MRNIDKKSQTEIQHQKGPPKQVPQIRMSMNMSRAVGRRDITHDDENPVDKKGDNDSITSSFASNEQRIQSQLEEQPTDQQDREVINEHELYRKVPPLPPLPPEVYQNEEDFMDTNIEIDLETLIEKLQSELSNPVTPSTPLQDKLIRPNSNVPNNNLNQINSPAPTSTPTIILPPTVVGDVITNVDIDEDEDENTQYVEPEEAQPTFPPVQPPKQWAAVLKLLETAKNNDFFGLFGLDRTATLDQVSAKRRQLNKELHPDQFQDKEEKEKASQKLALVNQIYTNVFAREKSLKIYLQICLFREEYPNLLQKNDGQLQTAIYNLIHYQREMTKAYMPQQLILELDEVLQLLKEFRPQLNFEDWNSKWKSCQEKKESLILAQHNIAQLSFFCNNQQFRIEQPE